VEKKHLKEIYRKLIHVSSLVIPLGYRFLLHEDRQVMFLVLLPLTLGMLLVEVLRWSTRASSVSSTKFSASCCGGTR
jgi:dolichol kinase